MTDCETKLSSSKDKIANAKETPVNKMSTQTVSNLSSKDQQDVRNMSHKLRQLKRKMLLTKVEASVEKRSAVDIFRRRVMRLAVEQEAVEARKSRFGCVSGAAAVSCDDTRASPPLGQIQEE